MIWYVRTMGFRKLALVLVGLVVFIAGIIYVNNKIEENQAVKRMALSELAFEYLMLKPVGDNFMLSGRITNNSKAYTLTEVCINMKFQDCQSKPMSPQEWLSNQSKNRSEDYSAWIAKNPEKRGTADYDTVAKA